MNKVILCGRLTRDPEIRFSQGADGNTNSIAKYTLAVDRRRKANVEQATDFISCTAFGGTAQFAEKYLRKGTKIMVTGRIQTGSYTNKDGVKVYTTDVIVEEQEFAESKASANGGANMQQAPMQAAQPNPYAQQGYIQQPQAGYAQPGYAPQPNGGFTQMTTADGYDLPFNM